MGDRGDRLGDGLAAAQPARAVLVQGPGDPDWLAELHRGGRGGQPLGGARHGLADIEVDVRGEHGRLLAVERQQVIERTDPVGTVAAGEGRQAAGDGDRPSGCVPRLGGDLAGDLGQFGGALLDALARHAFARDAVGVGGDDVGAGGDEVVVDRAHDLRRHQERRRRPDFGQDRHTALQQLAPGAAVEQQRAVEVETCRHEFYS